MGRIRCRSRDRDLRQRDGQDPRLVTGFAGFLRFYGLAPRRLAGAEAQVEDRQRDQGEERRRDEPADHHGRERLEQLEPRAAAEDQHGDEDQPRRERGHQDRRRSLACTPQDERRSEHFAFAPLERAVAVEQVKAIPRRERDHREDVLGGSGFTAPSDKLNIAGVGVGGMGRSNLTQLASQNIVALCDVDFGYVDKGFDSLSKGLSSTSLNERLARATTPEQKQNIQRNFDQSKLLADQLAKAKRYQDYREMLAQQKDIDAVMIATPDHMHAAIALAAMDLGKHVYVQKPLTWSVEESRKLAKKAKENPKIATQMGNQGHSLDDARKVIEYIQAGAIGEVKEVHVWTNRPLGYWPQGVPRPASAGSSAPDNLGWSGGDVDEASGGSARR